MALYTDLLDGADWYQSFNGNLNVTTTYPNELVTTANSTIPRINELYANDVPFGTGQCLLVDGLGAGASPVYRSRRVQEDENLPSYGKPRRANSWYTTGSATEFWIKLDSTKPLSSDVTLLEWVAKNDPNRYVRLVVSSGAWLRIEGTFVNNAQQLATITINGSNPQNNFQLQYDTWHLITITDFWADGYLNNAPNKWAGKMIIIDGKINANLALGNATWLNSTPLSGSQQFFDGEEDGISGTNPGVGLFLGRFATTTSIKIAHLAFWANNIPSMYSINARYLFGKPKTAATNHDLIMSDNPWWYIDFNSLSNDQYGNQYGSYVTANGSVLISNLNNNQTPKTDVGLTPSGFENKALYSSGTFTSSDNYGLYIGDATFTSGFNSILNTGNWTIEGWVQTDATEQAFDTSLDGNGISLFNFSASGSPLTTLRIVGPANANIRNADTNTTFQGGFITYNKYEWPKNGWRHVVLTSRYNPVDGNLTYELWQDGGKNGRGFSLNKPNPANSPLSNLQITINEAGNATDGQYPRRIDSLAIYNRTLTDSEIAERYNNYVNPGEIPVFGYRNDGWNISVDQKVYNGSDWVDWQGKYWDGDSWEEIN